MKQSSNAAMSFLGTIAYYYYHILVNTLLHIFTFLKHLGSISLSLSVTVLPIYFYLSLIVDYVHSIPFCNAHFIFLILRRM